MKQDAENSRMAKLYREHVLGEKPVEGLVSLNAIAPAKPQGKRKRAGRRRLSIACNSRAFGAKQQRPPARAAFQIEI